MFRRKVIFGIFLFLMFGNFSFAQITGEKFAVDNVHWYKLAVHRISYQACQFDYENIYLSGDTIINNKYCQKIYKSSRLHFDSTCMQLYGYSYYYNKRLYTSTNISIDTTSDLQYDFNLSEGDTVNLKISDPVCSAHYSNYYKVPVDSVDSIYYGAKWRKRIIFKHMTNHNLGPNPVTWVEGIGDYYHGLGLGDNVYGFIVYCYCDYGYQRLMCFQEPGDTAFGGYCAISSCTTITGVNTEKLEKEKLDFEVFPNPTNSYITLTGIKNKTTIKIYDILGNLVFVNLISAQNSTLDVSQLSSGVYTLVAEHETNKVCSKLIINR